MEPAPHGRPEVSSAPITAAALVLALAVFGAAWPEAPRAGSPCATPAEVEAAAGHTRDVRCDAPGGAPLRGPARMLFGQPIDPNRADTATLEALPGIGPSRAAAIVAERGRRPFADVAELERVPGIGPKTRAAVGPWVSVGGEAASGGNR